MNARFPKAIFLVLLAGALTGAMLPAQTPPRAAGVVTAIDAGANQIKLKTDAGPEMTIFVTVTTKFKRVSAGAATVADINAAPEIAFAELTVGDRVVAVGKTSADGTSTLALRVLVMTKDEVVKKQAADQADWQKRGVAGNITAVDPASKQVTISYRGPDGTKPLAIVITARTQFRRYGPDFKFNNAKPGTFADLAVGDQMRALGTRSADGGSYAAEEVVSGALQSLAATVISVDAASGTIKVKNLDTKSPVTVQIGADSSLHRMPVQMATMMANRAMAAADAAAGRGPRPGAGGPPAGGPGAGGPPAGGAPGGRSFSGGRGGGGGDLQQMIERMPVFTLAELKPGDALIISGGKGADPGLITALTMLAGVEPILSAVPESQRGMMLGGWSIDAGGGAGGTP
jgi:hypothetical protein